MNIAERVRKLLQKPEYNEKGQNEIAYEKIKAIFKSNNDYIKDICSEMINMISRKIEDKSNGKL